MSILSNRILITSDMLLSQPLLFLINTKPQSFQQKPHKFLNIIWYHTNKI